ncbi:hypothetical protein LCGC14_0872360 [marine sediment metagenome]|uniref:Uncharacterized protein n=1 Tax=marine sediment metagenome TaxID=412755 RepID=A0A0F9P971_9ZZZZ
MAEDWSTRELCLSRIVTKFEVCRGFRITASEKLVIFNSVLGTETDPITRGIFGYISQVLTPIVNYMRQLLNQDSGNDPEYMIPYFLDHYTISEDMVEFDLTWEKINAAWIDAPKQGRLMTVLTFDELRRSIWGEEFTYFKIAEPPF